MTKERSSSDQKRTRLRRWLFIPPIVAGVLVVFLMVNSRKEIPRTPLPERSVKVEIVEAVPKNIQVTVVGYGTAAPSRSWTAISEVGGRITAVHPALDSGNWIEAGETLVNIDNEDYSLRLEQRSAELRSAEASLAELRVSKVADERLLEIEQNLQQVTNSDLDRSRRLLKRNAGSTSEVEQSESNMLRQTQSVQRLKNSLSLYPARMAAAEAKVAMAESAVREAQRNVDRTTIRSPISGVLSGVELEPGQIVGLNQRLFEIRDNKHVEVEAQISLSQLKRLMPDNADTFSVSSGFDLSEISAEIIAESGTQKFSWTGQPVRLTEAVDEQTRTIGIVVAVENRPELADEYTQVRKKAILSVSGSDNLSTSTEYASVQPVNRFPLKPGTYCAIHLIGRPIPNVISIPRTSLDGNQVYYVDKENRLRSRAVKCSHGIGDEVMIASGIAAGDRVVRRPPMPAIEGMLVRLP